MKRFETGAELAKEMGLPESKLAQVFADYVKVTKDPKTDPFGKKLCVPSSSSVCGRTRGSRRREQLPQHRLEPQQRSLQRRRHDSRPSLYVPSASSFAAVFLTSISAQTPWEDSRLTTTRA